MWGFAKAENGIRKPPEQQNQWVPLGHTWSVYSLWRFDNSERADGSPGKDHRRYLIELVALGIQFAGTVLGALRLRAAYNQSNKFCQDGTNRKQQQPNSKKLKEAERMRGEFVKMHNFGNLCRRQSEWTTEGLLFAWHHAARACLLERISAPAFENNPPSWYDGKTKLTAAGFCSAVH